MDDFTTTTTTSLPLPPPPTTLREFIHELTVLNGPKQQRRDDDSIIVQHHPTNNNDNNVHETGNETTTAQWKRIIEDHVSKFIEGYRHPHHREICNTICTTTSEISTFDHRFVDVEFQEKDETAGTATSSSSCDDDETHNSQYSPTMMLFPLSMTTSNNNNCDNDNNYNITNNNIIMGLDDSNTSQQQQQQRKMIVRSLFHIWNAALATGDPSVVTSRYTKDATMFVVTPTRTLLLQQHDSSDNENSNQMVVQIENNQKEINDHYTKMLQHLDQVVDVRILESHVTMDPSDDGRWATDSGVYEFTYKTRPMSEGVDDDDDDDNDDDDYLPDSDDETIVDTDDDMNKHTSTDHCKVIVMKAQYSFLYTYDEQRNKWMIAHHYHSSFIQPSPQKEECEVSSQQEQQQQQEEVSQHDKSFEPHAGLALMNDFKGLSVKPAAVTPMVMVDRHRRQSLISYLPYHHQQPVAAMLA